MTADIARYGLLSDCRTAALVTADGSVDWWPGPRFDGATVFGRMLDPDAGHFSIRPAGPCATTRAYVDGTMVLESTMRTASGTLRLTDALAFAPGARGHQLGIDTPDTLVRTVEVLDGTVAVEIEFRPRPAYGLIAPRLVVHEAGLATVGGPERLFLSGTHALTVDGRQAAASVELAAGERLGLTLARRTGMLADPPAPLDPFASLQDTVAAWRSWTAEHQADGAYAPLVQRSLLVLQALTYQATGALVAAPTTSLPARLGGDDTWDYRYGWLRDAALTARALRRSTCADEAARYFAWMTRAAMTCGEADHVQIVYGVEGERALHEVELGHLRGFADSRPVRIGNAAWQQLQLDVLGEVVTVAHQLREEADAWDDESAGFVRRLIERAARDWERPDAGIWEGRDGDRHFTASKLMCWVALDRGIELAPLLGAEERIADWTAARAAVRATILDRGWCERIGAFAGALDSDHLDVAVLLIPIVGFLPATDPRVLRTLDTLERELGAGGLLRRWTGASDGGFVLASYWLAEARALAGDVDGAVATFQRVTAHANDLGLLSEQIDPDSGRLLGNFPQGLSHMGLVNAASAIDEARRRRA